MNTRLKVAALVASLAGLALGTFGMRAWLEARYGPAAAREEAERAAGRPSLEAPPTVPRPAGPIPPPAPGDDLPIAATEYAFLVVDDATKAPVEGATIESTARRRFAKSDARGVAAFRPRKDTLESSTMSVRHPAYATAVTTGVLGRVVIVPLARGRTLRGVVIREDTSATVPDVHVDDGEGHESTTDRDGRFRLDGLAAADVAISLVAQGFAPREEIARRDATDLLVTLPTGNALFGAVFDAGGRARADVPVALVPPAGRSGPTRMEGVARCAITDANGAYEILGVPGGLDWQPVAFFAANWAVRGEIAEFEPSGSARVRRDVIARHAAPGTLRIAVPDVAPETDVAVGVMGDWIAVERTADDRLPSGEWEIADLTPGAYRVAAAAHGFPIVFTPTEVPPGGTVRCVVSFPGQSRVSARVLDAEGRPVVGVNAWWKAGTASIARTDADGRLSFGGLKDEPGRLIVEGQPPLERRIVEGMRPSGDTGTLVLRPRPKIVLHATGVDPGTRVAMELVSDVYGESSGLVVGDAGLVEIPVAVAGWPSRIVLLAPSRAPLRLDVPALGSGEVRDLGAVVFRPGRSVRLAIEDAAGRRVPGATLRPPWIAVAAPVSERAGDEGTLDLAEAIPEEFPLFVGLDEPSVPWEVRVPAGVTETTVRLEPRGTLDLTVVGADGAPARGAGVFWLAGDGRDDRDESFVANADAAGLLVRPMPPGTHHLRLRRADRNGDARAVVTVRSDETTKATVRLP